MNVMLPDVSLTEKAPHLQPLEWVGMQGIDLPLKIVEQGYEREVQASADLQVDLPVPHVKGIHMSRLYRLLDSGLGSGETLSAPAIHKLLQGMVETHEDCGSQNARLRMMFKLMLRRSALITDGIAGWKSYPIKLDATIIEGSLKVRVEATVVYSSTCPCSAALSRQLIQKAFLNEFEGKSTIKPDVVAEWLHENATLATPHSQRSEAKISVDVGDQEASDLGMLALIDCAEDALRTPVQTAVKRVDEQAFAALNGQNLMFVEDAARRLGIALTDYKNPEVSVRHMESLHPHDAVAWAS